MENKVGVKVIADCVSDEVRLRLSNSHGGARCYTLKFDPVSGDFIVTRDNIRIGVPEFNLEKYIDSAEGKERIRRLMSISSDIVLILHKSLTRLDYGRLTEFSFVPSADIVSGFVAAVQADIREANAARLKKIADTEKERRQIYER